MNRINVLCERMDTAWSQGDVGSDDWAAHAMELIKLLSIQAERLERRIDELEAAQSATSNCPEGQSE